MRQRGRPFETAAMTQQQVSDLLGVTVRQVQRLEASALRKMRNQLDESEILDLLTPIEIVARKLRKVMT